LLVRATYIWVLLFANILFVRDESQIQRNAKPDVAKVEIHRATESSSWTFGMPAWQSKN